MKKNNKRDDMNKTFVAKLNDLVSDFEKFKTSQTKTIAELFENFSDLSDIYDNFKRSQLSAFEEFKTSQTKTVAEILENSKETQSSKLEKLETKLDTLESFVSYLSNKIVNTTKDVNNEIIFSDIEKFLIHSMLGELLEQNYTLGINIPNDGITSHSASVETTSNDLETVFKLMRQNNNVTLNVYDGDNLIAYYDLVFGTLGDIVISSHSKYADIFIPKTVVYLHKIKNFIPLNENEPADQINFEKFSFANESTRHSLAVKLRTELLDSNTNIKSIIEDCMSVLYKFQESIDKNNFVQVFSEFESLPILVNKRFKEIEIILQDCSIKRKTLDNLDNN